MGIVELASVFLGSTVLTVLITSIFNIKKTRAETTSQSIKTALELEERAHTRYTSALEALDIAQQALDDARNELNASVDYIIKLQNLLRHNGIEVPELPKTLKIND